MTKIPRHFEPHDFCSTSIDMLRERIRKVLEGREDISGQLFFPDSGKEANAKWEELDSPLNVFLFGDLLRKFFQTGNYVHNEFHFFQLSSPFQAVFHQLLLKKEQFNRSELLSRYELFPQSRAYDFGMEKEMNLIYAGRLSYQKNIPFLLYFVKACADLGLGIKAHLYGNYDNQFHEHLGRRNIRPLEDVLKHILEEEELRDIIFFRGQVDSKAWPETSVDQPIATSMSTFIGEDFGVSLAQAQEKGWPILCSEFGGHKDIYGESVCFLPSSWIGHSHLPLGIQKILAKKLADNFIKFGFLNIKENVKESKFSGEEIRLVSLKELDEGRRSLALELGMASQWLNLEGLDVFSDLKEGCKFIRSYLDILETSKKEGTQEVCFIFSEKERETLESNTLEWFQECVNELSCKDRINFIFEGDLQYGDSLLLLKRSNQAYSSPTVGPKTSDFIKKLFPN